MQFAFNSKPKELKDLTGFNGFSKQKLESLKNEMNLALHIQDLIFIQDYFKKENRDPTETEIYVLDCYWSDHCRHTTFETILDTITIKSELFQKKCKAHSICIWI